MKAFIIIPTYNEKENIARLVDEIFSLNIGVEIVVVDDNSPDGTGKLLDSMKLTRERLHPIHRPGKLGLGTAHITGIKYAIEKGAEFVITMDADFSHDPSYLPKIMELAKQFDVVIGSKYVLDGELINSPLYRRLLSRFANLFTKVMLNMKVSDYTGGFRCYKTSALKNINFDRILSEGYSFLIEMLYRLNQETLSIWEFPIKFRDRKLGISKISKSEIFKALKTVIRLGWERMSPFNGIRILFHSGRYKKVRNFMVEGKTLDIGCGKPCECMPDQAFLRFLNDVDNSIGIDIKDIHGPYKFLKCNIDAMSRIFKDEEFNNIVAMEILEHIPDVHESLMEIKKALKPNGKFIMTSPDNNIFWKMIWFIWSATIGKMWHNDHISSYNAKKWHAILEQHFQVVSLKRHWYFDLVFECIKKDNL